MCIRDRVSSFDIEIFVLFNNDKKSFLFKIKPLSSKLSEKFGKLSTGKHKRLNFEFSAEMFNLF